MKAPAANVPDLLRRAELARHADLVERIKRNKTLTPAQRRELAELEAKYMGKGPEPVAPGLAVLVSTEEQVALSQGVDVRTVQRWKHDGDWPANQRGPYDLAVVGSWVRARRDAEAKAPAAGSAREDASARRLNAMAEIAEMEARKRRGELLDRADVFVTWREQCGVFRTAVESVSQQYPEVAKEIHKVIAQIDRDLRQRYSLPTGG